MIVFERVHMLETSSTQAEVESRLQEVRLDRPTLITAGRQTSGRGSRGRTWQGLDGNLFASFALPMDARWQKPHLAPYAVALAMSESIRRFARRGTLVQVKWPNDILVEERKIAGTLITTQQQGAVRWVVIGIGINVAAAPSNTPFPAACLNAVRDVPMDLELLIKDLSARVGEGLVAWLEHGFTALRAQYRAQLYRLGERIILTPRGSEEGMAGRLKDIAEDGALLLETSSGVQPVYAGDIFPDLATDM